MVISFNTHFLIRINGTMGVLLCGCREYFVNPFRLGTPTPFARKNSVIFRIYALYVSFSLKMAFLRYCIWFFSKAQKGI